ncbi:MAG: LysM peptidoglycan-binding domain-containing protein, partial [Gordonia sp. (in: high G+C Gram-positive bacteria)]
TTPTMTTPTNTRTRYSRTRTQHAGARRLRPRHAPDIRRPVSPRLGASARGTRCVGDATPAATVRRRAALTCVVVGAALAGMVWIIGILGNDYQRAMIPSPVSTEVVHVRAGDSLSSIAERVAPDLPRQTVVDEIIDLNGLPSSGLRVGQPLLAPSYR